MSKITDKPKLSFKQTIILLIVVGIALFAASGYYWYKNVLLNPDRTLSGMLDKSLQSSSVAKSVEQESGGQGSVQQAAYIGFNPKVVSQSITQLQQAGIGGNSTVVTDTIGTKSADYVRYNSISIPGAQAASLNKIVGAWGKRNADPENGQPAAFLDEALLSVVPFGDLNGGQREEIKAEIKKVNLYKYTKADTHYVSGRPVISYQIDLDPQALVQVLSKYNEVTNVGSGASLNPSNYQGAEKLKINLQVDALSRHIRTIEFTGSGRIETYRGYNSDRNVKFPEKTVSIDELQNRLQSIEQQQ